MVDAEFELWRDYGNLGWPARYLFDQERRLFEYHYGEGAYDETELAIQELLGVERPTLAPVRPEDAPGAAADAAERRRARPLQRPLRGRRGVGGARRRGNGHRQRPRQLAVDHPGAYELIAHDRSTAGTLELEVGDGVRCHAVCFTPGLA